MGINGEEFFKAFGIEKYSVYGCTYEESRCPSPKVDCDGCSYYKKMGETYPHINDSIVLKLIFAIVRIPQTYLKIDYQENYEDFKQAIVDICARFAKDEKTLEGVREELKEEVHRIFKREYRNKLKVLEEKQDEKI